MEKSKTGLVGSEKCRLACIAHLRFELGLLVVIDLLCVLWPWKSRLFISFKAGSFRFMSRVEWKLVKSKISFASLTTATCDKKTTTTTPPPLLSIFQPSRLQLSSFWFSIFLFRWKIGGRRLLYIPTYLYRKVKLSISISATFASAYAVAALLYN